MKNIISLDIGSEVTCAFVTNIRGKVTFEGLVPTQIRELREVIKRVSHPRMLVFEECAQAQWLWSELEPICDDVLVCKPGKSGEQKSDRFDARKLNERARLGELKRVWQPGKDLQDLRQAVFSYRHLTKCSTQFKNQITSVFLSRGIRKGRLAHDPATRDKAIKLLAAASFRVRVKRLGRALDVITEQRQLALEDMIKLARRRPGYKELRTIDGIGPKFAAFIVATLGDPSRFRTRKQLWSYSGLAVRVHETGQYEVNKQTGEVCRKKRRTRTLGLNTEYNRTLKYVFKQAAKTLSRTRWSEYYQQLLKRSKNESNAQLTVARKLAAIVLRVAKTGESYDVTKAFKKQ